MKNLLYLSILSLIAIVSCDNPKNVEKVKTTKTINAILSAQENADACTDSGYQIYLQTAIMWEGSWRTKFTPESGTRQSLNFSQQNIASLKSLIPDSDGIRLYYCLISSNETPSLAMVNIKGCDNQYGANNDAILFSDPIKGQYFESSDTLIKYSTKWEVYIDNFNPGVHSPVYAYNYSWEELANTITPTDTTEFFVTYGLRALSADEYDEYHDEPAKDDQIMGSIVYCNIIYGDDPNNSNQQYFNFARPCPIYCNPN